MMLTLDKAAQLIVNLVAKARKVDRPSLERQWSSVLMSAAVDGELNMHDAETRMPIRSARHGAVAHVAIRGVTSLQEINRWLSEKGIDLALSEIAEARPKAIRFTLKQVVVLEYAEQSMNQWANRYFEKEGITPSRERVLEAIHKGLNRHFNKDWEFSSIRRHLLPEWTFVPFAPTAQKAQNNTM